MEGEGAGRAADEKVIKGSWSPHEDQKLVRLVKLHGPWNWSLIASGVPGRSDKSCRLRWRNHLSPDVQHQPFTLAEDAAIAAAHVQYGNKWSAIARLLRGRSDNAIKNRWNSALRSVRRRQMALARASSSSSSSEEAETVVMPSRRQWRSRTMLTLSVTGYDGTGGGGGGGFVRSSVTWVEERRRRRLFAIKREMIGEDVNVYKEWLSVEAVDGNAVLVGDGNVVADAASGPN